MCPFRAFGGSKCNVDGKAKSDDMRQSLCNYNTHVNCPLYKQAMGK